MKDPLAEMVWPPTEMFSRIEGGPARQLARRMLDGNGYIVGQERDMIRTDNPYLRLFMEDIGSSLAGNHLYQRASYITHAVVRTYCLPEQKVTPFDPGALHIIEYMFKPILEGSGSPGQKVEQVFAITDTHLQNEPTFTNWLHGQWDQQHQSERLGSTIMATCLRINELVLQP